MSDVTRTRPPDMTTDHREPPRRPMAAGHVMLVCLVALAVGFLLNAQGILKTAKGQPLGWKRDVAIAVAQPVADISHFLRIDEFRSGLQDALGRSGDDEINESSPSPTTLPPSVTTTLPKKLSFSAAKKLRLWTGGDSLGDFPGTSLINAVGDNSAIDVVAPVDAHISTGLARPEVFNWPAHVQEVMDTLDPDAIAISLGSNDNQAMTGDGSNGASFGTPEWRTEYSRRVGGLMDEVVKTGRTLFWIGVPIVRQDNKLESYQYINAIYEEQAALTPGPGGLHRHLRPHEGPRRQLQRLPPERQWRPRARARARRHALHTLRRRQDRGADREQDERDLRLRHAGAGDDRAGRADHHQEAEVVAQAGVMFWLWLKKLSGSHSFFRACSRLYFSGPNAASTRAVPSSPMKFRYARPVVHGFIASAMPRV